jgi:hypothetical protein
MEALQPPQAVKLTQQVSMSFACENPRSLTGDFGVICPWLVVMYQEVHRHFTPIDVTQYVQQPRFRAAPIRTADDLKNS